MKSRNIIWKILLLFSIASNISLVVLLYNVNYRYQKHQHGLAEYWRGVLDESLANAAHGKTDWYPHTYFNYNPLTGCGECDMYIDHGYYVKAAEVGTRDLTLRHTADWIRSRALAYELGQELDKAIVDYQFIGTLNISAEDACDLESSLARLYFKKGDTASAYQHYRQMILMIYNDKDEFVQNNRSAMIRKQVVCDSMVRCTELIPFHDLAEFASFYEAEAQKDPSQDADTQTALQIVREMMEQEKQGGIDLKH